MASRDEIGNLWIGLTMDTAAFEKGATIAEKRMASWGKRMESVGKRIGQVGTILTASITLPLTAFAAKSFDVAKDAAELQSAFDQTFGSMAGAMNQWAEATGNAMGRSTRELQEGANAFGLYFNQAAKTRAEAAKMSQTFTVLAQDLASFHNTGVDEAMAALRSGLSGEAEPLRRFGVFLNEAAVAAKAAELGLQGVNGKLTDQQKIMARSALILEQTKNAQGDVGRTSESTANQMRRAAAAFEELQIIVGTKLLPVLTPLIEKLAGALEWFTQLPQPVQNTALAIAGVTAVVAPLMMVLGPMLPLLAKLGVVWTAFNAVLVAAAPIIAATRVALLALLTNPVVLGAAVMITGIYLAFKHWDQIKPIVQNMVKGVADHLRGRFKQVMDDTRADIEKVRVAFHNLYDKVVGHSYVPDMVDGIAHEFGRLASEMVGPAEEAAQKVQTAFADLGMRAIDGFASAISDVITGASSMKDAFANLAKSIIADLIQMTTRMLIFRAIAGMFGAGGGGLSASSLGGLTSAAAIPGMANGGSGTFGGFGGVDRNVLSLNGSPIARVSRGENFSVSPANDPSRVVVELRDEMLSARIAQGANVQIVQAYPTLQAGVLQTISERGRRR